MGAPTVKFGYLPDPVDRRDRTLGALLRAAPQASVKREVDYRPWVPEILDQQDLGSCAAQAVFGAIRLKHALNGVREPKLGNRLIAYWGARGYIGTTDWDSGSHLRDVFRFLNHAGYMPEDETEHGYDISQFRVAPSPQEQRKMFDQRDKGQVQVGYYRIFEMGDSRVDAIKRALSNGVIPVLGTETTQSFLQYEWGVLPRPRESERSTGGHAVYLCGYDEDSAYVANSWNKDYGEKGFMRLRWDYITWNETRDIWGIGEAPYYSHLVSP